MQHSLIDVVTHIYSTTICKYLMSNYMAIMLIKLLNLPWPKHTFFNILLLILGQNLCRGSYSFSCHYFIHDKKNCQCKLYAVNQEALLYKYDDDSRKIGGFDKPDLSLCPSFQQDENFCSVSSAQCLTVCILIYIISIKCIITFFDIVFYFQLKSELPWRSL